MRTRVQFTYGGPNLPRHSGREGNIRQQVVVRGAGTTWNEDYA